MRSVWAYALYTPYGRISDWFRTASEAPGPRPWGNYRSSDLEVQRQYIGDLSADEERRVFQAASVALGYEACRQSPQAVLRDRYLAANLLHMLADVPGIGPAE